MQQGSLVDIEITDLNHTGEGVGRFDGQVIFVPDTVIGDHISARILHLKRHHAEGKIQKIIKASPYRIRPRCIVADKCGGCQWHQIDDHYQSQIKHYQVIETLKRIGGFSDIETSSILTGTSSLGYRNKATYPLGQSTNGNIQTGYYRRQSHQIVNLNQCPVQDPDLNPLLAEIKQDIQARGWTIYNETTHQGQLRHLALRIGRKTREILLTLITTDTQLSGIEEQADIWLQRYSNLVGVTLNYNPKKTNVIFGDKTHTIAGLPYLRENFAGLTYHLRPDTFFQVNTEAAEALLGVILEKLALNGSERILDAYCGIGTFTLPLAQHAKEAVGIEMQKSAIEQAKENAKLNGIDNVSFFAGTVETILPQIQEQFDIVILDPPRKGCDHTVLDALLSLQPSRIVYVSCQAATLARDLKYLCQEGKYQLTFVQPADFFPQTPHVECVAFLSLVYA
ncbi:23S rRNA (uracil(1939)-C(5))-methyltransferase RlmD [Chroococcus sp. FPU101]|uniref:23S rRNA (uracil(1939)-C(5))-methyltransferase RlmD n=1 Tax=Chroococcus sp. FPU101 TaxID=1974212 RepID=UPI001A8EED79|nr:23S rRNA (uracil(1939)-C(5))-methyltransferase RlmD [Chroococcus sp. FPU101]GFE71231.1 probable RNA methyltransferase [Chroococcus sp. FPU101]